MNKIIKLYELIIESADKVICSQRVNGSFTAGHNGVRFDPETPARNTGAWLITLLNAYKWTGEEKYLEPAQRALEYLLSTEIRPMGAAIWHRKNPEKDFCNGLLGQAFTVEALITAYEILGNEKARDTAENIFLIHPFNEKVGAWQRVSVDGSYLPFDSTFNHQLCFAAAGALAYKRVGNEEINRQVLLFMDKFQNTLRTYKVIHRGLIKHPLFSTSLSINGLRGGIERIALGMRQYSKKMIKHALGYHSFNMYAFALLYHYYPEHKFWNSKTFKETLQYMKSKDYKETTESAEFSCPYSPAGFETAYIERAFVLETFFPGKHSEEISRLLAKHFEKTYNFNTCMMDKCTADPLTQAARIYKATRLKDVELDIPIGDGIDEQS